MIKHLMQKRPRLTLLSIYISEFQEIGRRASVEIMLARKSVCRMPFVCFFFDLLSQQKFDFSLQSGSVISPLRDIGEKFCRDPPFLSFQALSSHIWS